MASDTPLLPVALSLGKRSAPWWGSMNVCGVSERVPQFSPIKGLNEWHQPPPPPLKRQCSWHAARCPPGGQAIPACFCETLQPHTRLPKVPFRQQALSGRRHGQGGQQMAEEKRRSQASQQGGPLAVGKPSLRQSPRGRHSTKPWGAPHTWPGSWQGSLAGTRAQLWWAILSLQWAGLGLSVPLIKQG